MKISSTSLLAAVTLAVPLSDLSAEEVSRGFSAVFVVEKAPDQGADADDKVERYTPAIKPGPDKWMVAIAKAPPNSTVLMVAYEPDGETLFRNLPPVVFEPTASSGVAKFPDKESDARWPYQNKADKAELFVLIFAKGDPETAKFRRHAEGLIEAIDKKREDAKLLHSAALKSAISNVIRRRSGQDIIARYPSTSIAGIRRGLPTGVGAVGDWNKKSDTITCSKGEPGLLLYRIQLDS